MREGLGFTGTIAMMVARFGWPSVLIVSVLVMILAFWRMGVAHSMIRWDAWGHAAPADMWHVKKWMVIIVISGFAAMIAVVRL